MPEPGWTAGLQKTCQFLQPVASGERDGSRHSELLLTLQPAWQGTHWPGVRGGQMLPRAESQPAHHAPGSRPLLLLPEPCRAKDANPHAAGLHPAAQGSGKAAARPVSRGTGSWPCHQAIAPQLGQRASSLNSTTASAGQVPVQSPFVQPRVLAGVL